MKKLVAYFSASGVTANVAEKLAEAAGADLFEIKPAVPYTRDDLNWMNKKSRSSLEAKDPSIRPEIAQRCDAMGQYDVVFVGFPIWWYTAPSIIKTFLEGYDFSGKTIVPFATSGGSGMGKTSSDLQSVVPAADVKDGKILNGRLNEKELSAWAESF